MVGCDRKYRTGLGPDALRYPRIQLGSPSASPGTECGKRNFVFLNWIATEVCLIYLTLKSQTTQNILIKKQKKMQNMIKERPAILIRLNAV